MDNEQKRLEQIATLRSWLTRASSEVQVTHTLGCPDGLPEPERIEGHQPQLLARGLSGTLIIGLVKAGPDFTDEQSLEEFRALGHYIDPLTDERAALNVAVPKDLVKEAERGLALAGLSPEEFNIIGLPS